MIKIKRGDYNFFSAECKGAEQSLVIISDIHYGSPHCDLAKLKNIIDYCKKSKSYVILLGDLIENATKTSIGAGWAEQECTPQEQIIAIVALLSPIKSHICCSVKGNHEERTYKLAGVDISYEIMSGLGIPERYFGWEAYGMFSTPHHRAISFYGVHSGMGSKTGGLSLNAIQRDISAGVGADIVVKGHSHKLNYDRYTMREIDTQSKSVSVRDKIIANAGHFLKRAGSYAAARPMIGCQSGAIEFIIPKINILNNKTVKVNIL